MTRDTTLSTSVIICVYTEKRWGDILDAVASVQQQSAPPREIIIVVDHNPTMLERVHAEIPGVIAVENSETQGLSGARNSGLAVAQGALIAFLDDDATAEPDWLERLSRCCEDPKVMGAGGTVEPEWLSKQPRWFPEEFYWVLGCTYQKRPAKPVIVRNPFGGCTCYRRELFDAVGGFRSGIGRVGTRPMGGEETELCIRGHQHWPEKVFLYDPQARIHHRIPAVRATWSYFRARCYAEGLSKATIAEYVGAKDGLSSERSYIISSLAGGILHGLRDMCFRLDVTGLQRAVAIVAGLVITVAGYLVGAINLRFSRTAASSGTQGSAQPSLKALPPVSEADVASLIKKES
jgi:glucosyl-dolichyl phosphate glucuronosyltransferase